MRLRIDMVQGGVELVCRKMTALILGSHVTGLVVMIGGEASEVALTQSEHFPLVVLKL